MAIDNPLLLFGSTISPIADSETLAVSAEDASKAFSATCSVALANNPAMDRSSVQRPDKPSPCPRCQSLDTKFCYFNNYNMKQPRHFCRNCQRYWTAGGSLRNVPVGAGRRKHKSSANPATSHPQDDDLVSVQCLHSGRVSDSTSGMRFPSVEIIDSTCAAHEPCSPGRVSPLAVQRSAAMAKPAQDCFSGLNGCKEAGPSFAAYKPAEECSLSRSYVCHGTQPYIQQKDEALRHSQPNLSQNNEALYCTQPNIQQKDEAFLTETLPASYKGHEPTSCSPVTTTLPASSSTSSSSSSAAAEDRVLEAKVGVESSILTSMAMPEKIGFAHPTSSERVGETSMSTYMAMAEKLGFAHPSSSDRGSKANLEEATPFSKSMPMAGALGPANPTLAWSQMLMWPWLWPYIFNNAAVASGMPHVDQAAVSAAWASAATAAAAATAASFLQFPPLWSPYGWGAAPWNVVPNVNNPVAVTSSIAAGKRPRSPAHEQEPLCIPKTLRIGHPEEAAHSSILTTLGLASLPTTSPASVAGFFNENFQSKPEVFQHKPAMAQVPQQHLELQRPHTNPAAQARSLVFQETN